MVPDYLDLYIIHRWDYNTPIGETMEAMHRSETDLIQKSKFDAIADVDRSIVERVAELAEKQGVPRSHVALA